jgi:uncharacterized protein (DUF1684 family)
VASAEPFDPVAHRAAVEAVRLDRVTRLRDPMSWLTLVGLHWLHEGDQTLGGSPANEIVLHAAEGSLPAVAVVVRVVAGRVTLEGPDAALTIDGAPVEPGAELLDDEAESPTVLELASLRIVLIRRGHGRIGLRVRDVAAPVLRAWAGLPFFPIDPAWRLTGRLIRSAPGTTMPVPDVLGDVNDEPSPGVVELAIDGGTYRLAALESRPGHLWLVFGDATNGSETYGGGRFLVTGEVGPDDSVEVDFNVAYNPPCVFSPYATCPLPPPGNRLPIRVDAGEMVWQPPAGTDPADLAADRHG